MESGEGCKETFVNGFAQRCGRGISEGRMEEQCKRFGVGLSIGAVAEMSGWTWFSVVDWDKPKSVGSAVATEKFDKNKGPTGCWRFEKNRRKIERSVRSWGS